MSHLTDGEIHVYLDGALDLLLDHRTAEIREHLSRCEDCQSRLEEERRIRERASEILGGATAGASPSVGDDTRALPSFDTIREEAAEEEEIGVVGAGGRSSDRSPERSKGPSRQSSWYRGVAWAATVVLSLGLGWYARSGVVESDVRSQPVLRGPTPSVTTEAAEAAPARTGRQEAPPTASGLAQEEMQEAAPSAAETVESAESRAAALGLDQGAVSAEGSLAVPGLPVLSVAWETEGAESPPTLRVVQQLPSGESLSLRYTALEEEATGFADRQAAELDAVARAPVPEAEAPAEEREDRPTSVSRRHGPWLLEATAPLEPDSVRALLERLPPR